MSEYGSDYITLTDEEGNEVELEHLDTLEYEGETYMAFGLEDEENEDEISVVIMQVVKEGDEELLEEVEDEELQETIYGLFMERIETDEEDEEEND